MGFYEQLADHLYAEVLAVANEERWNHCCPSQANRFHGHLGCGGLDDAERPDERQTLDARMPNERAARSVQATLSHLRRTERPLHVCSDPRGNVANVVLGSGIDAFDPVSAGTSTS
jgi:hypothetical protein